MQAKFHDLFDQNHRPSLMEQVSAGFLCVEGDGIFTTKPCFIVARKRNRRLKMDEMNGIYRFRRRH